MSISACQLSRLIEQSGCTFTGVLGEFGHYGVATECCHIKKRTEACVERQTRRRSDGIQ
jgi:hypothetical protein